MASISGQLNAFETLSNLLVAMGYEPDFSVRRLDSLQRSNYYHPAVLVALSADTLKNAPNANTRIEQLQIASEVPTNYHNQQAMTQIVAQ